MSDYIVEIEGKYDLQQISGLISDEELGASEFVCSSISFHKGRITNIAKFKRLSPGTIPEPLSLVGHGAAQPSGTVHVWSGVMIVNNKNEAMSAYRAT